MNYIKSILFCLFYCIFIFETNAVVLNLPRANLLESYSETIQKDNNTKEIKKSMPQNNDTNLYQGNLLAPDLKKTDSIENNNSQDKTENSNIKLVQGNRITIYLKQLFSSIKEASFFSSFFGIKSKKE